MEASSDEITPGECDAQAVIKTGHDNCGIYILTTTLSYGTDVAAW